VDAHQDLEQIERCAELSMANSQLFCKHPERARGPVIRRESLYPHEFTHVLSTRGRSIGRHGARFGTCPQPSSTGHAAIGV
jgi:hypothetical protein